MLTTVPAGQLHQMIVQLVNNNAHLRKWTAEYFLYHILIAAYNETYNSQYD